MNAVWRTPIQPRPQTALLLLLLYIFSRTRSAAAACLLHFSISLYFSHLCIFSTKNKLAKLKGLLKVQPNGRRKNEPLRGFILVRLRCRPSWSLSTLGSKHACDKNRRSSVTYASISVFPPHPIASSRTTKYVVCCCPHTKSRSDLYSVKEIFGPLQPKTFLKTNPRKKRPDGHKSITENKCFRIFWSPSRTSPILYQKIDTQLA